MNQRKLFKLNTLAYAVMLATAGVELAHAGAGVGVSTGATGAPKMVPTYYANSPAGTWTDWTGAVHNSGTALRKFVDSLSPLGCATPSATLGQCIPIAVADTTTYAGSDYYEIGIVEYQEKMHSDLPKATTLRGYVQLETPANAASSKHIALTYPNGTPIVDAAGNQIFAVEKPHYLGPLISATRGTPVRMKYSNLLPKGHFDPVTGSRGGDLFIPVDHTLMGAGEGPNRVQIGTKTLTLSDGITTTTLPAYEQYTQNRAEIHLHGGDNPWISDGTPHQWTVPNGEATSFKTGASFQNVPDMPDPGQGSGTLYYPNGDSGRLMFYHDHSAGITRLNVYAGEAAGYLLSDPVEQGLVTSGAIPATQIPLVIQEKTFVPADIAQQDAKWDTVHWGQPGDLWFPHVYETNQDPTSFDGTNPPGRWDWGPWFWPVFPSTYALPDGTYGNETTTPEAFMDTPLVNGTVYPTLTVDPTAVRFRILNAANDRMLNLGLYVAEPLTVTLTAGGTGYSATPVVTVTADPADASGTTATATATVVGGVITAITPVVTGTGFTLPPTVTITDPTGTGATVATSVNTEVKMVPASAPPATMPLCSTVTMTTDPNTGLPTGAGTTCWPDLWPTDGRAGGVPDPLAAGPQMVQIGNEGGILPAPSVIPSTPVNYEYNRRSVTVLNVSTHGLYMGPAERADVVVDFSQFAGKTLIVYNDSPAPVPAFDPRVDYYTGGPDQTAVGGAAPTLPGYGPNTRTIMQIKVNPAAAGAAPAAFNSAALTTALPAAFAASQPKPIVAETAYNTALGTASGNQYANIFTGTLTKPTFNFVTGDTITYKPYDPITKTILPTPVTIPAGGAASIPVLNKAIQELFEPNYGRMNATLGVELPFTSALTQTTIPLGYIDPATETIGDGETQIWKITHNGVDTHPVHFHLVNVQVINRIGWDGTVKPPADNEVGWKETVKMNPLEDIVVAVRAKAPATPFGLPTSSRLMDPTQPAGSMMGFTQVNPATGNPLVVTNQMTNYGFEYVWHCHILGHEENDFMRPVVFNYTATLPAAPNPLSVLPAGLSAVPGAAVLSWVDPTPAATSVGNPANEVGFRVERASVTNGVLGSYTQVATAPANTQTYSDNLTVGGNDYSYRVAGYNAAGIGAYSNTVSVAMPPIAPVNLAATPTSDTQIALSWADGGNETGYSVQRCAGTAAACAAGPWTAVAALPANTTSYADTGLTQLTTYTYQVTATNAMGSATSTVTATTPVAVTLVAATGLGAQMLSANQVQLSWVDNSTGESGYQIQRSSNGGVNWGTILPGNITGALTSAGTGATMTVVVTGTLTGGTTYMYRVMPLNGAVVGPVSNTATMSLANNPTAPSNVVATAPTAGNVALTWNDTANNNAGFTVRSRFYRGVVLGWSPWSNVTVTPALLGNATGVNLTAAQIPGYVAGGLFQFGVQSTSPNGPSGFTNSLAVTVK